MVKAKDLSNKKLIIIVAGLIILLAAAAILTSKQSSQSGKEPPTLGIKKAACAMLTDSHAKFLLGDGAKKTEPKAVLESTDDVKISQCTYKKGSELASLTVRDPKTEVGIATNKQAFNKLPAGVNKTKIYGDADYWYAKTGEYNVLKHNTWYSLQFGPAETAKRDLSQTQELADMMASKF